MERHVGYIPKKLKAGVMLVHNHIRPKDFHPEYWPGGSGFRAWVTDTGLWRLRVCRCGWAPHLPKHFRIHHPYSARAARKPAAKKPKGR
jgi:hypothetical protein